MSKVTPRASKVYKPEILTCPKCGKSIKYCYTISNKAVQFTSGKCFKIKNLGYKCNDCNDNNVYFSQTAHKLCFKGCTYSAKILCTIDYYKNKKLSREKICDILATKEIEISDRNVAILYKKIDSIIKHDYDDIINKAYNDMLEEFKEIRLSIDLITIEEFKYVILYNYFNGDILAIWKINSFDDEDFEDKLNKYLTHPDIRIIVTVRNIGAFVPKLKKYTNPKVKYISYLKF